MPKYIIRETYPCWVTWTRLVEANSEAEALDLFNEGEGEVTDDGPEIGNILDGYDIMADITEMATPASDAYDDMQAKREGWALFQCDDGKTMIQRLDDPQSCGDDFPVEPIFQCDDDAIAFVRNRASQGSAMHQAALRRHDTTNFERLCEAAARKAGWTFDEPANEYRLNDHGDGYDAIDANKTWQELCDFHKIAY